MQRIYEWRAAFGSDAFQVVRRHFEADIGNIFHCVEDRIQAVEALLGNGLVFRYKSATVVDGKLVRFPLHRTLTILTLLRSSNARVPSNTRGSFRLLAPIARIQ